jgi:hypothetical protein
MIEQQERPRKRIRELSPEELRAYKRASMEKSRNKKRAEEEAEKAVEATRQMDDIHEFWAASRKALNGDELAKLQAQDSDVRDQLWWIRCQIDGSYNDSNSPHYCDPNDIECYVEFEEGVADLVNFVRANPCPHLGAWLASELPLDWGSQKFWADPRMMESIASEGYATEVCAKYGYLIGIPDWRVYFFLIEELPKLGRKKWSHDDVAKLLGMVTDSNNTVRYPKVSP